jgi:hypothetical protein
VPGERVELGRKRVTLPALSAHAACSDLPVAGHSAAIVCLPLGATESRPVVLVVPSGPSRAVCEALHATTRKFPFVLCPASSESGGKPGALADLEKGLRAALGALKAKFTAHVDPGSVVLVARGVPAEQSVFIAQQEPSFFRRLILIDGGVENFSAGFTSVFGARHGERVLFVCTDDTCRSRATVKAALADRDGVDVRVAVAAATGTEWPTEAVGREWDWLIAGDERYRRAQP